VPGHRLTIRHGSRVEREQYDDLRSAIDALERRAADVRAAGPLSEARMLRTFEPSARVAARIELSTGGWLRRRDAGVDVMGDGSLVAYTGGIRRERVEPRPGETVFDALRRELGH
jgi:hypothetical protein